MTDYDFIINGIRFSHSSTSSFDNCAYGWKLHYIDSLPSKGNFYGEYGTLIHTCMEKFFTKEVDEWDLPSFYKENYDKVIVSPLPVGQEYLYETYRKQGESFFDNFSFPLDEEEIVLVEDKIDFNIDDFNITARPDLVLLNKKTKICRLYDYKTSVPFKIDKRSGYEIIDEKKIDGYKRQMYIYTYALRNFRNIDIDNVILWFVRVNRELPFDWKEDEQKAAISWLKNTISQIKIEKDFFPNNSNQYFCNNLCDVRDYCEYR